MLFLTQNHWASIKDRAIGITIGTRKDDWDVQYSGRT